MKGLVLAGGLSSRMKTDKATLTIGGQPLYQRAIDTLRGAGLREVYLSSNTDHATDATILKDTVSIGPASGLLSAFAEDPESDWFILAVDFPHAQSTDIQWLINKHTENVDITCYMGRKPEPLFAIWSPNALEKLKKNVSLGETGPLFTLESSEAQMYRPRDARVLTNTNTPEEFASL